MYYLFVATFRDVKGVDNYGISYSFLFPQKQINAATTVKQQLVDPRVVICKCGEKANFSLFDKVII